MQSSRGSVQHLTPPVLGRSLGEQGRGRVCGIMRLRGAPRPGLNSDAPVSYIVHSVCSLVLGVIRRALN